MKRFFSIFLIAICVFTFSISAAFASGPTFGGGDSNMQNDDDKVAAIVSAVFSYHGIKINDGGYLGDSSMRSAQYVYSVVDKIKSIDNTLYDKLKNTPIYFVEEGTHAIIDLTAGQILPTDFVEVYNMLFGDNAISSGEPVEGFLQTQYTINVDGQEVVPWRTTLQLGGAGKFSINSVKSRGDFIPVFGNNYSGFFNDVYSSSNHRKRFTFSVLNNSGSPVTVTTNTFGAGVTDNASGQRDYVSYTADGQNWAACLWLPHEGNTNEAVVLPAWIWVMNRAENQVFPAYYSYIYSGTLKPQAFGDDSYIFVCCGSTSFTPRKTSNGTFDFTGTIRDDGEINVSSITVQGDSYTQIVNNYFNDTLNPTPTEPTYTDPNTWPTSPGGGTMTPNDDGGFNLDWGNFHLPDLNIDWKLDVSGLRDKFPFSIPFDLVDFFTILNVEPETPQINGEVDLIITTWYIDYDLSEFDDIAAIFRETSYILFVISLIVFTVAFVKR